LTDADGRLRQAETGIGTHTSMLRTIEGNFASAVRPCTLSGNIFHTIPSARMADGGGCVRQESALEQLRTASMGHDTNIRRLMCAPALSPHAGLWGLPPLSLSALTHAVFRSRVSGAG
jgi:hypothetical protein